MSRPRTGQGLRPAPHTEPPWPRLRPAVRVIPPALAEAARNDPDLARELGSAPRECWRNDWYVVLVDRREDGSVESLSIRRADRKPARDWRQRIKNQLAGKDTEGAELFPADSRLVDTANHVWIWCLPPGRRFPFGFRDRLVLEPEQAAVTGAVQRPFAPIADDGYLFTIDTATARDWLARAADAGWITCPGELPLPFGPRWDPRSAARIAGLIKCAVAAQVIKQPGRVGQDGLAAQSTRNPHGTPCYQFTVTLPAPRPLVLAGDAQLVNRAGGAPAAEGPAAAESLLDEAVCAANLLLTRLDQHVAAGAA